MEQVPKVLKPLVNEWAAKGFIVSFKVSGGRYIFIGVSRN
jgi:hypothetical protein